MTLRYKNIKNNDISTIDMPPGMPGVSKNLKDQTEDRFDKIQPKLNKIQKAFRTQGFYFCSILMVFHSFFNFDWILVLQLTRVDFRLKFL